MSPLSSFILRLYGTFVFHHRLKPSWACNLYFDEFLRKIISVFLSFGFTTFNFWDMVPLWVGYRILVERTGHFALLRSQRWHCGLHAFGGYLRGDTPHFSGPTPYTNGLHLFMWISFLSGPHCHPTPDHVQEEHMALWVEGTLLYNLVIFMWCSSG